MTRNRVDAAAVLGHASIMTARDNFHGQLGIDLLEWREGFARITLAIQPRHLNRSGILHGGVLLTMLDEAGGLCGAWCSVEGNRRSSVTVDLDCRFVGQCSGGTVYGTGELVSHGKSLYFTRVEVTDADGRVLAYGASSHKWRRGSASVEGMPAA